MDNLLRVVINGCQIILRVVTRGNACDVGRLLNLYLTYYLLHVYDVLQYDLLVCYVCLLVYKRSRLLIYGLRNDVI